MKPRKGRYNPKRKLQNSLPVQELEQLASKVKYGGNPEHKRNPGNFGLTPPSDPRPHKTLCDDCGIFNKSIAESLLTEGAEKGIVSAQMKGQWPQNIWAVTREGHPVEAQLENEVQGTYHGYPMPEADPMRQEILKRWSQLAIGGETDHAV
ncbi:hypothetical protein [Marinobacter sp. SS8-8]|jgi:hypothetical protein|uniref:hypothetical protein n=1 Tax=Marinobacter sp. SS8-8 TaxID=3050452 RepID=UPI0026DF29D1|nr:hypothetical protein [Marinobacter sp. SS8-8]|tara:strand:- start:4020 stop:4472 length:453 start_codon:yes stop_codon:yes gene_type:complete